MIFDYRLLGLLIDEYDQAPGWVFEVNKGPRLKSLNSTAADFGEVNLQDVSGHLRAT